MEHALFLRPPAFHTSATPWGGMEMSGPLPKRFYGDPSERVEEMSRLNKVGVRAKERIRIWKGQRIRALVKQAMKGVKR